MLGQSYSQLLVSKWQNFHWLQWESDMTLRQYILSYWYSQEFLCEHKCHIVTTGQESNGDIIASAE